MKSQSRRVHRHEEPPPQGSATIHDEEGAVAPRYIPAWALPQQDLDSLMSIGAEAANDIVYAQGVPADPNPDINAFNRKDCSLILIEVGLCRDLGCHEMYTAKTDKYLPLLNKLRRY